MSVMISQPMKGKSEDQIRSERAAFIAQLEAEGLTVMDTVFPDFSNQGNIPLKRLAKSLEAMADADCVYFMPGWDSARGCLVEYSCCLYYDIPHRIL